MRVNSLWVDIAAIALIPALALGVAVIATAAPPLPVTRTDVVLSVEGGAPPLVLTHYDTTPIQALARIEGGQPQHVPVGIAVLEKRLVSRADAQQTQWYVLQVLHWLRQQGVKVPDVATKLVDKPIVAGRVTVAGPDGRLSVLP